MHIQYENFDDTSMSILKDLDPNYGNTNVADQRTTSKWKAITLTMGVASIALVGWTVAQNLDAKVPDDAPAPSTIPVAIAVKPSSEVRVEDANAQAEGVKGAVIDESKAATTTLASNLSPLPEQSSTSDGAHEKDSRANLQNTKGAAAKPNKGPAPKSRKIGRPQSRSNKSLADRDVAIIRSLVK
ncbi:MAG: hypothetical protein CVU33_03970 [Betaproteobacteria bacterium HGW-Betaproteobacteria-6]|nr:MAG: hypothetical protein CVU33_03970 [Betaproteobacteria bacterium HGW-Betaproteobacteria-6]